MTRIYDYNPYSKPHPNSPLNMRTSKLPAIDPPDQGWEVLKEPIWDPDYPGVIFLEVDSETKKLSLGRLGRDLKFLGSNPKRPGRKVLIELHGETISKSLLKILKTLNNKLLQEKQSPYKENQKISGKLAIYTSSENLFSELQRQGLYVFHEWDDAIAFAADAQTTKDRWDGIVVNGEVKPSPEAVKNLIDELSNKNTPAREPLSKKDIAFNKLIDEMSGKNPPSITPLEGDSLFNNQPANEVAFYMAA